MRLRQLKPSSRRAAFTIVELLVAMLIGLIVSGVIAAVLISTWRAQTSQEIYTQLQFKSRTAVDEIATQIKSASGVMANAALSGTTYTTGNNVLVIRTPALDVNNNILPASDYFVFRRNPANLAELQRLVFADPTSSRVSIPSPLVLNDSADALVFGYYNSAGATLTPGVGDITTSESVSVSVTSAATANARTVTRQIDAKAFLRNN